MSTVPAAIRKRLDQAAVSDAADLQLPEPTYTEPTIIPREDLALMRPDGTLDLSVFELGDDAPSQAEPLVPGVEQPAPAPPALAAQTPAPLSPAQMQQVQQIDPNLAAHVVDMQAQVRGLVDQITQLRQEQANAAQLQAKVRELEQANAQLASARQQADLLLEIPAAEGLSQADRDLISDPRLLDIMERVARTNAADYARSLASQVESKLAAIEAKFATQAEEARNVAQRSAEANLRSRVAARHPDMERVFQDPAFAAFLKTPAPFTRTSFADVLRARWADNDADTVSSIIDAFKKDRSAQPAPAPSASPVLVASQVPAPSLAPSNTSSPTAQPKKLAYSKYRQASAYFRAGLINADTFRSIQALYTAAEKTKGIDYNA